MLMIRVCSDHNLQASLVLRFVFSISLWQKKREKALVCFCSAQLLSPRTSLHEGLLGDLPAQQAQLWSEGLRLKAGGTGGIRKMSQLFLSTLCISECGLSRICAHSAPVPGDAFRESPSDCKSSAKEQPQGARKRKCVLRTQLSQRLFGETHGKTMGKPPSLHCDFPCKCHGDTSRHEQSLVRIHSVESLHCSVFIALSRGNC